MKKIFVVLLTIAFALPVCLAAQSAQIVKADDLTKILPASVYVDGENVPTQKRNAAAVQFDGKKQYVIAALVDTSGYSSQYQEKYIGTLIAGVPIKVESLDLPAGQYGFGRVKKGDAEAYAIYDISGNKVGEVDATKDDAMKPVRPLQMVADGGGAKLYVGHFVLKVARK